MRDIVECSKNGGKYERERGGKERESERGGGILSYLVTCAAQGKCVLQFWRCVDPTATGVPSPSLHGDTRLTLSKIKYFISLFNILLICYKQP